MEYLSLSLSVAYTLLFVILSYRSYVNRVGKLGIISSGVFVVLGLLNECFVSILKSCEYADIWIVAFLVALSGCVTYIFYGICRSQEY